MIQIFLQIMSENAENFANSRRYSFFMLIIRIFEQIFVFLLKHVKIVDKNIFD